MTDGIIDKLGVNFELLVVKAVDGDVGQVTLGSKEAEVQWNPLDQLQRKSGGKKRGITNLCFKHLN
jgi:hypothetical protein